MIPPTSRQQDLLRYIAGYQAAHDGISPSFTEMRDALGFSGNSNVHRLLAALAGRGRIRRLPRKARAIEIVGSLPLPRAPDGAPLYAVPIERHAA